MLWLLLFLSRYLLSRLVLRFDIWIFELRILLDFFEGAGFRWSGGLALLLICLLLLLLWEDDSATLLATLRALTLRHSRLDQSYSIRFIVTLLRIIRANSVSTSLPLLLLVLIATWVVWGTVLSVILGGHWCWRLLLLHTAQRSLVCFHLIGWCGKYGFARELRLLCLLWITL